MEKRRKFLATSILLSFFIGHFLYFAVLNRFHLWYFEQIQFFRFSLDYFLNFLSIPGGFIEYIGAFFIQFFHIRFLGALILTILAFGVFLTSSAIFKRLKWNGILFSLLPVLLLVALQSNYNYSPVYTFQFLCVLWSFAIYISVKSWKIRYLIFLLAWVLLLFLSGIFSFVFMVLCCLYELLYHYRPQLKWVIPAYIISVFFIFYFTHRFLYTLPFQPFSLFPEVLQIGTLKPYLLVLFAYFPVLLLLIPAIQKNDRYRQSCWNLKNIASGGIVCIVAMYCIINYSYNEKRELIFAMDYYIQHQQWDKVTKTTNRYQGVNQLVIYFTNLALSQQDQLTEKLFSYPQIGKRGLRLKWERNKIAPFYGGDVFFYLHNNNEAFRWAFESMVSNGITPRVLKRLIETSIANGHYTLAEKYLQIMKESLFYIKWVQKKQGEINRRLKDSGINLKNSSCTINSDFTSDINGYDLKIEKILENCPVNKVAFEYYMATLLLDKNVNEIWNQSNKLIDFSYTKIPTCIEEALLIYMNSTHQKLNKNNLKINEKTHFRFEQFAIAFSQNPDKGAQALKNEFGDTFWYYFYFY